MKDSYKIGDFVLLKSGGPIMTVMNDEKNDFDTIRVSWFDGTKMKKETFQRKH